MNEHASGHAEDEPAGDRIEPTLSGQRFVADHFRFWLHDDSGRQTASGQHPGLDDLTILTDLTNS
jgi:hypothetical protein